MLRSSSNDHQFATDAPIKHPLATNSLSHPHSHSHSHSHHRPTPLLPCFPHAPYWTSSIQLHWHQLAISSFLEVKSSLHFGEGPQEDPHLLLLQYWWSFYHLLQRCFHFQRCCVLTVTQSDQTEFVQNNIFSHSSIGN